MLWIRLSVLVYAGLEKYDQLHCCDCEGLSAHNGIIFMIALIVYMLA